ncbi:MAG TPA: tetratricopeptide repeat protein [Ktedonobacterales bacterium]|nr:tetratricopeptide repeat protein [Ktedonobacterales bacterium]
MNTTQTNTPPTRRDALLTVVDRARALEQRLAGFFDEAARATTGTVEVWAPKDHFVHLAVWQAYQARRLEAIATGNPPDQPAENDVVFLEHRDEPWDVVWANAMRALDDDAAAIARVSSDEDLTDPDRFPWTNGRSLVSSTIGNIYLHPIEHLVQMHEERGDDASAEQAQLESVTFIRDLFGKGEEYANAVYNLGCFYAKRGRSAEAIAQVREALAVNPELTEWSKVDSDLTSLYELPEYQALYSA